MISSWDLARFWAVHRPPLPITYLGLPLHFKKASFNDWTFVLDKLNNRLDCWKGRCLSLGGRLTLLNSVLSAIPTYYLSVLHLPAKVVKEIDKIRKRFLWNSFSSHSRGYHLVKWQNVCQHKHQDGLGIINISNFNISLKCKLLWKLLSSRDNLKFCRLLKCIYVANRNIGAILATASRHASPIWKELKSYFNIVNIFNSYAVNNGNSILFWESRWNDHVSLKFVYPELFSLVKCKKWTLAKMISSYQTRGVDLFYSNPTLSVKSPATR